MWRSMDPTQTSSPLFPTKNNLVSIFENIAFLDYFGVLRSANTGPKTRKRMQRTSFFLFFLKIAKISKRHIYKYGFKKKKLKQRYFFVKFSKKLQPCGKLLRNLPSFCFHSSATIKTCKRIHFSQLKATKMAASKSVTVY